MATLSGDKESYVQSLVSQGYSVSHARQAAERMFAPVASAAPEKPARRAPRRKPPAEAAQPAAKPAGSRRGRKAAG